MPKALVVSRYFPPLSSVGASIRLVKFIKYIASQGWSFEIFTQDLEKTVIVEQKLSASLLQDLPQGTVAERIAAPFSLSETGSKNKNIFLLFKLGINNFLHKMMGDSSIGWGIKVFWKGLQNWKKRRIDLIYVVTPPFTNALIGTALSWVGHKPLILDIKDDWVGSAAFLRKSPLRQKIESIIEYMIVRQATDVITVTKPSYEQYQERYKGLEHVEKFHLISNGCDLEEYSIFIDRQRQIETERFTLLSTAWGYRKDYRDLTSFLSGLNLFIKRHPESRERIQVIFLGNSVSEEYQSMIDQLDMRTIITELGVANRSELIEWMWKADQFLLIQPVNNTTAISGTLFEYWAVGKAPVLLISENGASSVLVEENHLGKHCYFDQVDQIAAYIESLYSAYQTGSPIWIKRDGIEGYDRKMLALRMADIWQRALKKKP